MITIELLNQMAIADGEDPFNEGDLNDFEPNELYTESANGETINPRALVAFAHEIDQHIQLPEISSPAAQRLEAFIHNFQPEGLNNKGTASEDKKKPFFDLAGVLPKNLGNFGQILTGRALALPAGGTFAIAACAVLLFTTQVKTSQDWESRYAELAGASSIKESYQIDAGASFFERPSMAVRGQKIEKESSIFHLMPDLEANRGQKIEKETGNQAKTELADYIENNVGFRNLVPVLRATQAQGLVAAKMPEHRLWLLFRGTLESPTADEPSSGKVGCLLVEAINSEKSTPPLDAEGVFLSYCPLEWSDKISLIASQQRTEK